MMYTLNVHHAVMSAALHRAMAKCQRPATGSAAYGALGPSRATGGGKRAGAELLRHAQGAVRGPDATVRQGARGRRDARSCAHHRDGIPASGTRSSPYTGAGGGGIHLRRDSLSLIAYSEELISSTISATLQSTDRRHGIVGQKCSHFQRA